MEKDFGGRRFHFEINSFEDFVSFVALIKGKEIDLDEIKNLTSKLNVADNALEEAIDANKPK